MLNVHIWSMDVEQAKFIFEFSYADEYRQVKISSPKVSLVVIEYIWL